MMAQIGIDLNLTLDGETAKLTVDPVDPIFILKRYWAGRTGDHPDGIMVYGTDDNVIPPHEPIGDHFNDGDTVSFTIE
jgi:hypothetical protein